jgi:hypothetical protein
MKNTILLFAFLVLSLIGCKKNEMLNNPKNSVTNVSDAYKGIAAVIVATAKEDNKFRTIAYQECGKQKYGDYYVKLNELISLNEQHKYWNKATIDKLLDLQKLSKRDGNNDVIIFIPSIENHPEKALLNISNLVAEKKVPNGNGLVSTSNQSSGYRYQDPIAVIADEYENPTKTCPGYIVVMNGVLSFFQNIDEEFAWEHDVWVVGEEENCSPENMIAAVEDGLIESYSRFNGRAEYGGIIKVVNWSLVEPWVAGKPEFRSILNKGAGGGGTIHDKKYGKWRRIHFNGVFRNFGTFLFNWNLSTIGDWTTEKWIEEDGGASSSISTTITWKDSFGNTQTTTTSIPSKNKDDDLGQSIIQFTDQINQEYNLTGIIIKRSH